jgi:hypothetical protein
VLLEEPDHPRREPLVHEAAVPGVDRRVGVEEEHAPGVELAVRVRVDPLGAAGLAREQRGVAVDHLQVLELRDRPEPRPVGLVGPVDGVLGAEDLEHRVVPTGDERVEVEQVHLVEPDRIDGRHGIPPPSRRCDGVRRCRAYPPDRTFDRWSSTITLGNPERSFGRALNERSVVVTVAP